MNSKISVQSRPMSKLISLTLQNSKTTFEIWFLEVLFVASTLLNKLLTSLFRSVKTKLYLSNLYLTISATIESEHISLA